MRINLFAMTLLAFTGAVNLSAQVWTANATTAVPNFQSNGTVKTMTFDGGAQGKGVRPRPGAEGTGLSYLYIPVTAPQSTIFACIGLRADDSAPTARIRAEFWRQPRDGNAGPAVLMGAVNSIDIGFQFVTAAFAAHQINYPRHTYYIRLLFSTGTQVPPTLTAYDVSLSGSCSF